MKREKIGSLLACASLALLSASCSEKASTPADTGNATPAERATTSADKSSTEVVYRAIDEDFAVKVLSTNQLQVTVDGVQVVCQYSREGSRMQVKIEAQGASKSTYFDIIPDGLRDEDGTVLYEPSRHAAIKKEWEEEKKNKQR